MATRRTATRIPSDKVIVIEHPASTNGHGKPVWANLAVLPAKTERHTFDYPEEDPVIEIEVHYYTRPRNNPNMLNVIQEFQRTREWPQHAIVDSILALIKSWNLADQDEHGTIVPIPVTKAGVSTVDLNVLGAILTELQKATQAGEVSATS